MKTIVICCVVCALFVATAGAADIILGDLVGGGDGSGNAPIENLGINADTGVFSQIQLLGYLDTGEALAEVTESPYVDSVFIMTAPTIPITTTDITFDFALEDAVGSCYDVIAKNRSPDLPAVLVNEVTYATGVGIHSSAGVTFDLAALRGLHGNDAVKYFSSVIGGDACGTLDVNLYVILCDATGVMDSMVWHCTPNRARFVQIAIPDTALFLTLATGAANSVDWCDHGNFAEARITAAPLDGSLASMAVSRPPVVLCGGSPTALTVTGNMVLYGAKLTIEEASAGTTYTVSDPTILEVTDSGVVTGIAMGAASLTVRNGGMEETLVFVVGVDLGGIMAGGDGLAMPPIDGVLGINPDTGEWGYARLDANVVNTGDNPQAIADPSHIDSVFLMLSDYQTIHSGGLQYQFPGGDANANGWEILLNGREPGGPDYLNMGTGGTYTNGLGIHASAGITFDLASLRAQYGADKVKHFFTVAGEGAGQMNNGYVNVHVIASTAGDVLEEWQLLNMRDRGEIMSGEIPADAQFLTFATGAAANGIGGDHGCFAQAVIIDRTMDLSFADLALSTGFATLRVDDQLQLAVRGITAMGGFEIDVTDQAAYASDNTAVAEVDAAGLVTARGNGKATISVTFDDMRKDLSVLVLDFVDLGEIAAGGDGTADNPPDPFNLGIDIDTGLFGTAHLGTVTDTDGENPKPVDTQEALGYDFIDSTFLMLADSQVISTEGEVFEFPLGESYANGWDLILRAAEADWTPYGRIGLGPLGEVSRGVGVHASAGITFDLASLREAHGAENISFFSVYAGEGSLQPAGTVNCHVIMTDGAGNVVASASKGPFTDNAEFVELRIPAEAAFLTLAVGSNGDGIGNDHGVFGNAFLTRCSLLDPDDCGTIIIEDKVYVLMGNVNTDSKVDIADAIALLGYLFGGGTKPPPVCAKAADANDDNKLDIADAIKILGYLFSQQPMLAPDHSTITAAINTCTGYAADGVDTTDGKPYFPAQVSGLPACATQCQ